MVGSESYHHTGLLVPEQQVTKAVLMPHEVKKQKQQPRTRERVCVWGWGGQTVMAGTPRMWKGL